MKVADMEALLLSDSGNATKKGIAIVERVLAKAQKAIRASPLHGEWEDGGTPYFIESGPDEDDIDYETQEMWCGDCIDAAIEDFKKENPAVQYVAACDSMDGAETSDVETCTTCGKFLNTCPTFDANPISDFLARDITACVNYANMLHEYEELVGHHAGFVRHVRNKHDVIALWQVASRVIKALRGDSQP